MTANTNGEKKYQSLRESNWGPKLFLATTVLVLVFFWWLLIFSGGVGGHHGFKMNEFVDELAKTEPEVAD